MLFLTGFKETVTRVGIFWRNKVTESGLISGLIFSNLHETRLTASDTIAVKTKTIRGDRNASKQL
jgi:hypothetical protein